MFLSEQIWRAGILNLAKTGVFSADCSSESSKTKTYAFFIGNHPTKAAVRLNGRSSMEKQDTWRRQVTEKFYQAHIVDGNGVVLVEGSSLLSKGFFVLFLKATLCCLFVLGIFCTFLGKVEWARKNVFPSN